MTEIDFESYVVELAHFFDWSVAAFRPGQTSKGWRTPVKYDGKGYPDLTMIHPSGRIVFAELKASTSSKRSPEQLQWANIITAAELEAASESTAPILYRLWTPEDADEIIRLISFGRVTQWNITQRRHTR